MFQAIIWSILLGLLAILYAIWPKSRRQQLRKYGYDETLDYISYFHPFCDMGGGGERVLWTAIKATLDRTEKVCFVYIRSDCDSSSILTKVKNQFGFALDETRIKFISLRTWKYLEAKRYPRLTLILSSLGSMIPGWEAMMLLRPSIFVESVGYAFINPIVKLFGGKMLSYVHYPTISSDMLQLVQSRKTNFNNAGFVAKSLILSRLKLIYYQLFAILYWFVGSFADYAMVNSKWTKGHINWRCPIDVVYPPADTHKLMDFPLENRQKVILSVAQFRPEKDHMIQVEIMARLKQLNPHIDAKLVMLGSVRNESDAAIVKSLKERIRQLKLERMIAIIENAPYAALLQYLQSASIGLHTMRDEHFGISIIEYMAAGLVPLAHKSGGPLLDIVQNSETGFLADNVEDYAKTIIDILSMDTKQSEIIRSNARTFVSNRFSETAFAEAFTKVVSKF